MISEEEKNEHASKIAAAMHARRHFEQGLAALGEESTDSTESIPDTMRYLWSMSMSLYLRDWLPPERAVFDAVKLLPNVTHADLRRVHTELLRQAGLRLQDATLDLVRVMGSEKMPEDQRLDPALPIVDELHVTVALSRSTPDCVRNIAAVLLDSSVIRTQLAIAVGLVLRQYPAFEDASLEVTTKLFS